MRERRGAVPVPTGPDGLRADVVVARGRFRLDLRLDVRPGEVVALLGPNGAGKTTTLRVLAGLQPVDAGLVRWGGRVLDDPGRGVLVPPERRRTGVVFQDGLLFQHLDVLENVAFGLRAGGVPRAAARRAASGWLERVGVGDLARRRPRDLSGGQAQRVALARALVTGPDLLLLDEPLAALDAGTRTRVRSELRTHLAGYAGCTVLVTHDPLDAMVLADRIVVLEDGQVVQDGTPAHVAAHPRTDYVAELVGLNLHRGRSRGGVVDLAGGGRLTGIPVPGAPDGDVLVAYPPAAVALHRTRPDGSPRNTWPVAVESVERHGGTVRVALTGEPPVLADVTASAVAELDLVPGRRVWAAVKATEVRTYPA
ncbi:ABC transporter ATP-binding protein [Thalassiella azotivora]